MLCFNTRACSQVPIFGACRALTKGVPSYLLEEEVVKACCVNVGESLSGTDVIASASGVPEPSTLSFLGLGMAVLGFWRFRVSKPRRQRAH